MKKFHGNTLVETIMALFVLGIVVPTSLSAFGSVFMAELRIRENACMMSSAEWWFSGLAFPVRMADLDAAPRTDRHGRARFDWDAEELANGVIRVTLRVYGRIDARPFTVRRIF